jgi:hypothetical protein
MRDDNPFHAGQKVVVKIDSPGVYGLPFPHRIGEVVEVHTIGTPTRAGAGRLSLTSDPNCYWGAARFRPLTGFDILDELRREAESKTKEPVPA